MLKIKWKDKEVVISAGIIALALITALSMLLGIAVANEGNLVLLITAIKG